MKFEDSWENNTHQDVEDAIKDKVEEIAGRIDDVEESVPDAETIEAIRQAAQDAQDAAAAVGDIINGNSGRVSHAKAPAVVLRYIHQNDGTNDMSLDDLNAGDVYADAGGSLELVVIENGSKTVKNIGTIDKGLIFYSIREEGFFRYLGSAAWEPLSQGGGEEQEGTFAELDVDSRLKHIQSPVMALDCISQSEEPGIADCPIGGYYCYMGNQASAWRIRYRKAKVTAGQYEDIDLSSPQGHVLYYNKPEDKTYCWDGQRLVAVLWHAGLAIDNRLMSSRATAVVLRYISAKLADGETPMSPQSGDVYCDSNNHIIVKGGAVNPNKEYMAAASLPTATDADLGLPDQKLVYYDVNKKDFYRWNGVEWKKALDIDIDTTNLVTITQLNNTLSSYATRDYVDQAVQQAEQPETVVINSDGANIVDGQSDSILTAPSSRMVKEIYLNLQKLFDPVNGLANIAFVGTRPTWQSVAIPTHTITLGTMSNVSASIDGTTINGSTSASEGEVTILLTPSGNNYIGSISVKDASNNDVAFTQTDVAGGTEITFILSDNVTINASASSGIQVNVSGTGITSYTTGVQPDTAAQLTIALPEHHTWGTVSVDYGGTDITSQCTISQANNADKVITLPNNLNDMAKTISIVANANEDNHAVLTFGQLSNVTIKSGTSDLESGSNIYDGDTISIKPAIGYKLTGKPIFTNGSTTPVTLTPTTESGDIYNGYDFGFNPISNSTIAITNVGATKLDPNLRASLTGTGSESVDSSTDLSSNITEGSAWSTVLSVKSTAEEGTAITSVSPSMEGGGPISYDANTKRVHTDCVTGNITITVTVAGVTRHSVTMGGETTMYTHNAPSNGVVDGQDLVVVLTPALYCSIESIAITMGGNTLVENTGYTVSDNNGVKTVTIYDVTGDISISASVADGNPMFLDVGYFSGDIRVYDHDSADNGWCFSPIIDIEGKNNLSFLTGSGTGYGYVIYYNDKVSNYAGTRKLDGSTLGTESPSGVSANAKAIRLEMRNDPEVVYMSYIKSGDDYLFRGSDYVDYDSDNGSYSFKSKVKGGYDFLLSDFVPRLGDDDEVEHIFSNTAPFSRNNAGIIGFSAYGGLCVGKFTEYFMSEFFDIKDGDMVQIYDGDTNVSNHGAYAMKESSDGHKGDLWTYYGNVSGVRTITVSDGWSKIALVSKKTNKTSAYMKISTDGGEHYTKVWPKPSSEEMNG